MDQLPFEVHPPQPGRRRRFSQHEKQRILAEASRPGESLSSVGRRYNVSVALLFRWRRQLRGETPPAPSPKRPPTGPRADELRLLRAHVRELQRMLGLQALELEQLRGELAERRARPSHERDVSGVLEVQGEVVGPGGRPAIHTKPLESHAFDGVPCVPAADERGGVPGIER